jgi:hypothetical protein
MIERWLTSAASRGRQALLPVLVALIMGVTSAVGQQGPIRLFPDLEPAPSDTPQPEAAPPGAVQPPGAPTGPDPEPDEAPPSGFRVEGLAAPAIDAIGVLGPGAPQFDPNLWRGSDGEVIVELMTALPVVIHNPPLRDLTRRLLATGAPLDGASETGRLLEIRVERLLAMGDLAIAKALVDQLPPSRADSALARLATEIALLANDTESACRRASDIAPASGAAFWGKVLVVCRLVDGDETAARLGLDLLREAGQTDDAAFFTLAEAIAGGADAGTPPDLAEPSALHVTLARLARLPLPDAALRSASPAVLAAVAVDPVLAGDHQLEVAEQAFLSGGIGRDTLTRVYAERAPGAEADALAMIETDWGPQARALTYRAVLDQDIAAARAELLDAAWRAANGAERFLVAEALAAPFGELPIDDTLSWAAPSSARALLAADRPIPAAPWFSLLTARQAADEEARQAAARLAPLFALAGTGAAVPELDAGALAAAGGQVGDGATARLLGLLEGSGARLAPEAWQAILEPPMVREATVPAGGLWRGLERASAGQRVGETVLYALLMLDGRPEAAHPEVLVASLRALRSVGLDLEARAIAVATALSDGW